MKNDKIIRICNEKLYYLNYSKSTIKIYIHYISEFVKYFDKQYIHLNSADFQNYLDSYNFTSISQQNQVINAIRFLYKYGLNRKYNKIVFQRPRREYKLPNVIPEKYLKECLENISNLKHKTILSLTYSLGLRRADVQNLKNKGHTNRR